MSHLSAGSKTARPCFSHRKKGFCRRQDPVFLPCAAGKKAVSLPCSFSDLSAFSFPFHPSRWQTLRTSFYCYFVQEPFCGTKFPDGVCLIVVFPISLKQGKPFRFPCFSHITRHIFYRAGALAFMLRLRPAAAGSPGFFPGPRTFPGDRQLPAYPYPFQTGAPPGPFWAQ